MLFARPLSCPSRSAASQSGRGATPSSRVAANPVSASSTSTLMFSSARSAGVGRGCTVIVAILRPLPVSKLRKLVWFVPEASLDATREAVFAAGAGRIGNYERCSWFTPGTGTFRAAEGADPAIGEVGKEEHVPELRVETVVPVELAAAVVRALLDAHPYEEVAYELSPLVELEA